MGCQTNPKVKNTYKCVKDVQLNKYERRRVFNLFSALDAKHTKKLDAGEMSRLLQGIRSAVDSKKYPALIEAVSRSTYFSKDDLNKDKFVEFNEFLKAMTQVKNRDPKDFGVFLKAAKTIKPLKTNDVCRPNGSGDACPRQQTCRLTQKGSTPIRRVVGGRQLEAEAAAKPTKRPSRPFGPPSYKAPKYQCKRDMKLSSSERSRVGKLFHAMDKDNNHKLSSTEYSSLMHQVYEESRKTHDYSLQTAIYESAYYTVSDKNGDKYIELNEFLAGCTKLKNRDPKDFGKFLQIAARIKKLMSARRARTRTSPPPRAPPAPPANTPTANTPASATKPAARLKTRGASPSWTVESCTFTAKCCGGDASFTFLLLLCDHFFGRTNKQTNKKVFSAKDYFPIRGRPLL